MRIGWFTDVPLTRIIQRLLSAIATRGKHFYPYRSVMRTQHLFLTSFVRPILNLARSVPMFSDTACANISSSAAVQFGFLRTVTSVTGVSILKAIF